MSESGTGGAGDVQRAREQPFGMTSPYRGTMQAAEPPNKAVAGSSMGWPSCTVGQPCDPPLGLVLL